MKTSDLTAARVWTKGGVRFEDGMGSKIGIDFDMNQPESSGIGII